MNDFKFAIRQLFKSPGFTAAAVLTLGLAIGVNTAIFALVDRAILRPVVKSDPDSIVAVFTGRKGTNGGWRQFSHAEFSALREAREVFADVCAVNFTLVGLGKDLESQKRGFAFVVSDNYFTLHGSPPARGRSFTPEECKPGADLPVAIVSHDYARRIGMGGDVIGRTMRVNGEAFTIVGVAQPGFSGTHALVAPDAWFPLGVIGRLSSPFSDGGANDLTNPRSYSLNVIARLAHGLTRENVKSRLPVLDERLNALLPTDSGPRSLLVQEPARFNISTDPETDGGSGLMGVLFLSLAGVVLLIACLNLANMLLARGAARRKEIALRLALGASRRRVVQQLLVEGLVLALLGGLVGTALAYWANSIVLASLRSLFEAMAFSFTLVVDITPDLTVLAATFGLCLLATLFFSLGPALNLTRADLAHDLKQQTGEFAHQPSHRLFAPRHVLVMAQISLSLALVFCAALFFRGGALASTADPGFTTKGGVVAELDFSLQRVKPADALARFIRLRDEIAAMPGVASVALNNMVPFINNTDTRRVLRAEEAVDATPKPGERQGSNAIYHVITPGYFRTIGVPVLAGRDFTPAEAEIAGPLSVAIVDEKLATRLFGDTNVLGRRIKYLEARADGSRPEMEIVGIVRNTRHETFGDETPPHLYLPFAQTPEASAYFQIRLSNESPAAASAFLPVLRRQLVSKESDLPLLSVTTFANVIDRHIGTWVVRAGGALFGVFGGVALLIAAIGVYGVHAYSVSRRTREIGIRMSLGAQPRDVFSLIMGQGAKQTTIAIAIGVLLSLGAGKAIAGIVFRVSPFDPFALGGAIFVLALAALLACYVPARRATRVNPMTALRME